MCLTVSGWQALSCTRARSHKGILSWGWSETTSTVGIAYKHTFAPSDQLVNKLYHTPTTPLWQAPNLLSSLCIPSHIFLSTQR